MLQIKIRHKIYCRQKSSDEELAGKLKRYGGHLKLN